MPYVMPPQPLPPPSRRPEYRDELGRPYPERDVLAAHAAVDERYYPPKRLASERIILAAPMSFTGAAQRTVKLTQHGPALLKLAMLPVTLIVLFTWWALVLAWYCVFLIPAIIYRPFFGRRRRKAKREAARHRELLEEIGRR